MIAWRVVLATAVIALFAGTLPAQTGPSAGQTGASDGASGNEIVVSAFPSNDIVVNGRAIRCRPSTGDPLDKVSVPGWPDYMMIVPDDQGGFAAKHVTEQITGPAFWQRVGVGMGAYRFRAPTVGEPMCIGGRGFPGSFGGFRRIVDAAPYRGHRLRFTAWAATGRAGQVSFWLAAGSNRLVDGNGVLKGDQFLNGGNTDSVPFGGNHGWTPILIETGPIDDDAGHISYGFNLQGSGDVWVYEPKLELIVDQPENPHTDDLVVIVGRPE